MFAVCPSAHSSHTAHPPQDDARFIDTFLVALLSIGAALPVSNFIFLCFDMANDDDAPDLYLRWPLAWPMLVWGMRAHRSWHYKSKQGQPEQFVRWFIRFRGEPMPATIQNMFIRAWFALTCREMPWETEAREEEADAEEEAEAAALKQEQHLSLEHSPSDDTHEGGDSEPFSPLSLETDSAQLQKERMRMHLL